MGYTEEQIKWLLRWRSNAFFEYLRNLAITTDRHNLTMDAVGDMPNFL